MEALSVNETDNKLILCGGFTSKIYIMELNNDKWSLT